MGQLVDIYLTYSGESGKLVDIYLTIVGQVGQLVDIYLIIYVHYGGESGASGRYLPHL